MKIRFNKPPDLSRLCLTAGNMPAWHIFKNTFVLDRSNLRQFIAHHRPDGFDGKFVFYRGKLALHPGEDRLHRQIYRTIETAGEGKDKVIAAYFSFSVKGQVAVIELDEKSGQYGEPTRAEFARVAEYLAAELADLGFNSERFAGTADGDQGMSVRFWLDKFTA